MFCECNFIFIGKFFPKMGKEVNICYQELCYPVSQVTRCEHPLGTKSCSHDDGRDGRALRDWGVKIKKLGKSVSLSKSSKSGGIYNTHPFEKA